MTNRLRVQIVRGLVQSEPGASSPHRIRHSCIDRGQSVLRSVKQEVSSCCPRPVNGSRAELRAEPRAPEERAKVKVNYKP
ncbi:MAG: hypothetical protein JNK05_41455 [Myxococcales bacterium]|nr:hypothetical protein [Myxococcales bacterium]